MGIKPILFNTEMVKAILGGRKTQTRRLFKPHPVFSNDEFGSPCRCDDGTFTFEIGPYRGIFDGVYTPPYDIGDILWVRETWVFDSGDEDYGTGCFMYKADMPIHIDAKDTAHGDDVDITAEDYKWRPSIHMPKEAARIFLRVKDVRAEKLQDITAAGIRSEGLTSMCAFVGDMEIALPEWRNLWNSTIKKVDLPIYGWDANPWVWVIEFERCDMPEGWC